MSTPFRTKFIFLSVALFGLMPVFSAVAYDKELAEEARTAALRAAKYYQQVLSEDGSYVWKYAPDLSARQGEGEVPPLVGWVQPPGTPAVGAALLRLYEATGETFLKDAALETAEALRRTQLHSGGWYFMMELDPERAKKWCYRVRVKTPKECVEIEGNQARNRTLLDDDTTQSVFRFLIWLDAVAGGGVPEVRETIDYGLSRLATLQYPNGAWPVMSDRRVDTDKLQATSDAKLPDTWSRQWIKPEAGPFYIINDNAQCDALILFLIAAEHFDNPDYLERAVKAGDFLLDAQLPDPQPGWAQTYDAGLIPVWGRRFEPPSVTSRESADVVRCLTKLYQRTGDERYRSAALKAADWLEDVRLPDGTWARFYELSTNRPLYVDESYDLTYETSDLLGHYNLKNGFGVSKAIELARSDASNYDELSFWTSSADELSDDELESEVRRFVTSANGTGVWETEDWIDSGKFVDAIFTISRYLDLHS